MGGNVICMTLFNRVMTQVAPHAARLFGLKARLHCHRQVIMLGTLLPPCSVSIDEPVGLCPLVLKGGMFLLEGSACGFVLHIVLTCCQPALYQRIHTWYMYDAPNTCHTDAYISHCARALVKNTLCPAHSTRCSNLLYEPEEVCYGRCAPLVS